MEKIIFNIMKSNAHTWVRYFNKEETTGLTLPGEYIEIRTHFYSGDYIKELQSIGFEIQSIRPQKINSDVYSDILMKRTQ